MTIMNELEIATVGGGNPAPGQSWEEYLEEQYPGGEWYGNSYFPNGLPGGTGYELPPVY